MQLYVIKGVTIGGGDADQILGVFSTRDRAIKELTDRGYSGGPYYEKKGSMYFFLVIETGTLDIFNEDGWDE